MRVFVTGATGAVGSRLLPLLLAAGHSVIAVTHTPAKTPELRATGAEPVVADGLDGASMRAAVMTAKPDVIVHEMTALKRGDLRRFDRTFALSNQLRTEGLDHLLAAATEVGARRVIAQSYCGWPYARAGDHVKTEEDPLDPEPPVQMRRSLAAIRYLESRLMQLPDKAGLALRYGTFYGPSTGLLESTVIDQLRLRRFPLIGGGTGWWSLLHIDDAAAATAIAVERGSPGVYNIVDDEPAPVSEWLPALATAVGAKPPRRIPKWLAVPLAGKPLVTMMTESRAGSNAKARQLLGWQPIHRSWRTGFTAAVREVQHSAG